MNHQKSELYFLIFLLIGILVLTFFIFKPFLYALILAMVFATVFKPLHRRMLIITHQKRSLAALLATVSVLIIVIAPIAFLGMQVFRETTQLYVVLTQNGGAANLSHGLQNAVGSLQRFIPVPIEFSFDLNQYARQGLSWLLGQLGPFFANVTKAMLGTFIFLVALYYLFKDGKKLKKTVIALSPLQDNHDEAIFNKLVMAVNSVIKGSLAVAMVQGILTAVGFTIFGVPHAALWGSVAAIAALIPGIGTALVLLPAILYLFFIGDVFFAIGLFLWGMIAVGLVDNFLGPKLIERGVQLHPFLILLSILGGIGFFGPIGFLLGPLVLSLLFALFEVYFIVSKEHGN
ncbi:MAG: AI-2E family transporter [Patescibacteria group bacterium]